MTTSLTKLSLTQARDGLINKSFSAVELTKAHLAAMEEKRNLNAYITETPDLALKQAAASDDRIASGKAGALEGLPIAIKDLYCTKGVRTTAASKILDNFIPPYESTVTQNLWSAGAVMLGKVNMDEFAMGSGNLHSAYGPTINPWRRSDAPTKDLVPGGSSGGSVAAVAGHMALAATASDTGGSIRQPAAFCGLVGIKPTYGLCSRRGMVAFASSLDQAGPVARTVRDAALMTQVMASHDPWDSTSLNVEIPDYLANITSDIKNLRVGLPKEYRENLSQEMSDLLQQGIDWLKAAGATIVEVSLPTTPYALPTYYVIAPAEASSNLAKYDGLRYGLRVPGSTLDEMYENTRREGFGAEVRRRILIGTYVLSAGYYDAYYLKAQKVRTLISQDFDRVFKDVDVLLTPTTPTAAFAIDEKPADPVTMYLNDIFTVTVNLAALPGISVPAGLSKNGLPLGLQLIGPRLSEQRLFNTALALEEAAGFEDQVNNLRKVS
ncbi:MAG: Asp-tRNA(Asn)/Glu-tRNA(Gln) amidotransferase subunit GatA [Alphaproteobacteria bacterium]|jgi:aspartyl-tRNA(Asn)/glutamyl-tRNA(Gln) amidotransferase subunit A|nr:Asp-tRNA(Asn)/Glu-tRNA(Gln) amidotransferase subunit GatA [Alphaproteobacteria bacterium]